ncbi:metal ABC transporter solute-binding protein, Zn/Mn family [uncultured Ilumatobacter sp.]|uniref:metal ABC transporter solute-binding protein, Zn/Mn family n=1 Tax=uncultured Ilumatobacter sp. TaxID=879968 RepID=UPI00374F386D
MTSFRARTLIPVLAGLMLIAAACGSDSAAPTTDSESNAAPATGAPSTDDSQSVGEIATVVVTTNILGDVVGELLDGQAEVITIMPVGADPHEFQASAQEINRMLNADVLIVNGVNFEEGLIDVIESAEEEGVPIYEVISAVETLESGEGDGDHAGHGDEDHDDHGDEDHDDHEGVDPHFFADPVRMSSAVEGIVDFLSEQVGSLDADALDASADEYLAQLAAVDAEITSLIDTVDEDKRVLVTSHEVFAYFADGYGFEVVGVIIPGGSTTDAVSAGELAALAATIEAEGIPAIFSDTSSSDELSNALASEVGDIAVVELYTESLGAPDSDGATYIAMVRTNAERIAAALG